MITVLSVHVSFGLLRLLALVVYGDVISLFLCLCLSCPGFCFLLEYKNYEFSYARNKSRAFTLIELLVVTAIIGILAPLLLLVVGKAKVAPKQIDSSNNIRQLALFSHMFAADFTVSIRVGTLMTLL